MYNSKRVGNKVVNEYLGIDKAGEWKKAGLMVSFFVLLLLGIVYAEYGIMSGTTSGATSSLIIWDGSASSMDATLWNTPKTQDCSGGKTNTIARFYANYSNSTIGPIIGNCTIRFNFTGTYTDFSIMNYSDTTKFYELNRTFDRRGNFTFQVNCTNSTYDTLNITDTFVVENSAPFSFTSATCSQAPLQTCIEDAVCTYNASTNFSDDETNDLPLTSFAQVNTSSTAFDDCTSINSVTGIITIACTNSNQAGSQYLTVSATDKGTPGALTSASLLIPYTITAVNDKPIITASTLTQTCTEETLCSFYIGASDEENGTITSGAGTGIGFLNFTDNSTMFIINFSNGSISFTPENAQVGTHRIEINVTDPYNEINTSILTLTINNLNDAPNLTYACDSINNTILQEDVNFSCMLNATDIDVGDTHTYTANYSWFTISCGAQSVSNGNTSCNVTFAPTDEMVFSHLINITVTDTAGLSSSRIINFSVNNTPDFPRWTNISTNYTVWANVSYWTQVTATDDDSLTVFGDHVNYSANYTWLNLNAATGVISLSAAETASRVGTFRINITANDTTNRQNSTIINFTIYANSYPTLIITQEYNLTEGYAFSLNISANVTEPEGDYVNYTDNTSLFTINPATGIIAFTPTDSNVGTNWVKINITDSHGTINTSIFNFTVYNEEDAPVLETIPNLTNLTEGTQVTFYVNFSDADLNITGGTETINVRSNSTTLFTLNLNVTIANATNGKVIIPVTFTPSSISNGTYWINITLNDSAGLGDSQLVFLNVTEGNVAPMFMEGDPAFCTVRTAEEDTLFASCILIACDNDTSTTLTFDANYSWFAMNSSAITAKGSANNYCANVTVNFTPTTLKSETGQYY